MDDLSAFVGDEGKQLAGVEFHYPGTNTYFTIAHSSHKQYRNYVQKRGEREQRRTRKPVDPIVRDQIAIDGIAKFILKSWRGLGENGKEIEVNEANAKRILASSVKIRDFIITSADDDEKFGITAGESEEGANEELKSDAPVVP